MGHSKWASIWHNSSELKEWTLILTAFDSKSIKWTNQTCIKFLAVLIPSDIAFISEYLKLMLQFHRPLNSHTQNRILFTFQTPFKSILQKSFSYFSIRFDKSIVYIREIVLPSILILASNEQTEKCIFKAMMVFDRILSRAQVYFWVNAVPNWIDDELNFTLTSINSKYLCFSEKWSFFRSLFCVCTFHTFFHMHSHFTHTLWVC